MVNPDIERLLAADHPDIALDALDSITEVTREEATQLADLVVAWSDARTVSNMLMHPAIIPAPFRVFALLRGLATDPRQYVLVAAVVGLRSFEMPDDYRRAVGTRLVDLAGGDDPVAALASVTAAEYLYDLDVASVLARYHGFSETARHNVVAGLVDALGADDVRSHVQVANVNGVLDDDESKELLDRVGASTGGGYLLVPIPTLDEWNARPAPGAYPAP